MWYHTRYGSLAWYLGFFLHGEKGDGFVLREGQYKRLQPDADGHLCSEEVHVGTAVTAAARPLPEVRMHADSIELVQPHSSGIWHLAEREYVSMSASYRSLLRIFCTPVSTETTQRLRHAWNRLPLRLRTSQQMLGRQYIGCGATIGVMPRCDFACRGCYLGSEANHVPPQAVDEIKHQLRQLRAWLGEGGNVQLTDGEVTLRPVPDVIELIRYARDIGLVPMLMTHGDTFRRRPGLLEQLMQEGGLTEMSIHIDTTQRGRRGQAYTHATHEHDLHPLRDEFAQMIRRARRITGKTIEVATTVTVTRENLAEVPQILRWLCHNADAFKMIAFLPIAKVGRTEDTLDTPVCIDALWQCIAAGLYGDTAKATSRLDQTGHFGHPACNRFVQGVVVRQPRHPPIFHALFPTDDPRDNAVLQGWLLRFGGLTFRLDTKWQAAVRLCGLLATSPGFIVRQVLPFCLRQVRRIVPEHPVRFIWRWIRGLASVHYVNIVSHHFMNQTELATPFGQERLNLCTFMVPVEDKLMSMCEVNALGVRSRYYETIRPHRTSLKLREDV